LQPGRWGGVARGSRRDQTVGLFHAISKMRLSRMPPGPGSWPLAWAGGRHHRRHCRCKRYHRENRHKPERRTIYHRQRGELPECISPHR